MSKIFIIIAIIVLAAGAVYLWQKDAVNELFGEGCIQVITPAKNLATGECKEFPTPCNVPEGWKKTEYCPIIKYYVYKDLSVCARVEYTCPDDLRPFNDQIGCGCARASIDGPVVPAGFLDRILSTFKFTK